jgi:hypothetical protein
MSQTYPVIPKSSVTVDGTETLNISVDWRNGSRDRVRVVHFAVSGPTPTTTDGDETVVDMSQAQTGEVLVDGRSVNDLLRAFAQFMDWELEFPDDTDQAIFKFRS